MRRTKIVATLGPASLEREVLAAMIRAGLDVARLNTSHGDLDSHVRAVALVREVAAAENRHIAVLMDLGGPKIRTGGTLDGLPLILEKGATLTLTGPAPEPCTPTRVSIDYPRLREDVSPGQRVLLDDGNIELRVNAVTPDGLECEVIDGGPLLPRRGVSFPSSRLNLGALTPRDRLAINAGISSGIDYFAQSFVGSAEDLIETRNLLRSLGANTPIIAKIERRQAVEDLESILAEADGAMVARGDLGVELPPEDVPIHQRAILAAAGRRLLPVITATQMLESMVHSPRPTRAEVSDVANATWALSDALMLSEETAIGQYPVETVAMMDRIIRRAEAAFPAELDGSRQPRADNHSYVIAQAARRIVESDINMRGIVCFTMSGRTAGLVSKVHPNAPIFALSPKESVCRKLALARGVVPILVPLVHSSEEMLQTADRVLTARGYLREGEEVVVVASLPVQAVGATNFIKLHRVGESSAY